MTLPAPRPHWVRPGPRSLGTRGGFGIGLILVVLLFTILLVLLSAQSRSTRSLAFERNLSFLGSRARVATQNALNEAYYHFITRANGPKLSAKDPVDLYQKLRSLEEGQGLEYTLPPALTRKLLQRNRVSVSKVEVDLLAVEAYASMGATPATSSSAPSGVATSATLVSWPPPAGVSPGGPETTGNPAWPGRPGSPSPSRWCNLINLQFQPRVKLVGVVRFRVSATVDGPRSDVVRTVEVRKGFQVIQVTPAGDLLVIRLSPNDISCQVFRSVVENG